MKSISYSAAALSQSRKLQPSVRERIGKRLQQYATTHQGDVKKLQGRKGLRLRVAIGASSSWRMVMPSSSSLSDTGAIFTIERLRPMAVKFQGHLAIMPRAEYEAMKELADEAWEDRGTARIVDRAMRDIANGTPVFPLKIIDRLTDGENPIRVMREFRGLTQAELAASEDLQITQHYLSDLETGKRKGPIALHRKLARALNVPLDILVDNQIAEKKPDRARPSGRRKTIAETKQTRGRA